MGVQVPTWDPALFDLKQAAQSQTYCDEIKGRLAQHGIEITELSTHLQGQLMAVHPAYVEQFKAFAAPPCATIPPHGRRGPPSSCTWAARASARLGLKAHATFSGALLWPFMYPWPQRPDGLVEEGFRELARRWRPVLDVFADAGVAACFEIHPGEDLHDGVTFERFLDAVDDHPAASILYDPSHFVLQQLDYLAFIDLYHERIRAFHVKDAEFRPSGRAGVYGGYQQLGGASRSLPFTRRRADRLHAGVQQVRAVRLRRLGRDRVGMLPQASGGWRTRRRALHPQAHDPHHRRAFDDFAGAGGDAATNRRILGI